MAVVAPVSALLVACGQSTDGAEGDCSAAISFESVTYRSHNELASLPSDTERMGRGDVVGCNGEAVSRVEVRAIDGVDPSIAIAVPSPSDLAGIYVAKGVARDEWPDEIDGATQR